MCHENEFWVIGDGQEMAKIKALNAPKNVIYEGKVTLETLARRMADADVCLGIFGNTKKTKRVIPNKVYEAMAMGKTVITADTPAIRELLIDHKNVLLCKQADSRDLADTIKMLIESASLRVSIGEAARGLFLEKVTPDILVKELLMNI